MSQQQSLRKHEVGPSGNMCKRIHSLRPEKWLGHTITRDILQEIYFLHCKRYSARDTLHIQEIFGMRIRLTKSIDTVFWHCHCGNYMKSG